MDWAFVRSYTVDKLEDVGGTSRFVNFAMFPTTARLGFLRRGLNQ
jgi:hypothetical protein